MESPSMPASSSIAAPVPQPVRFPIAQQQVTPATAAGGRQGDLPAAGAALPGALGAKRIMNSAGEIITDGTPPSGSGPPGGLHAPSFYNGTQIEKSTGEGREKSHLQVLVEAVAEGHPIRVTMVMGVQVTHHRLLRKLPDL